MNKYDEVEFMKWYDEIFTNNHAFITSYLKKGLSQEDVEQSVALSLCKALKGFDKEKGNFKNYAGTILKNDLKREYVKLFPLSIQRLSVDAKKKAEEQMSADKLFISIDAPNEQGDTFEIPFTENGFEVIVDRIAFKEFLSKMKGLRSYEYILYRYGFIDGKKHSYREVSEKFNVPLRRIRYLIKCDLETLREMIDVEMVA